MNSDLIELLLLLEKYKVRYLVIGGYAFGAHAEPRYTKDLDLWVDPSKANAKRIFACLKEYGAPVSSLAEKHFSEPGLLLIFGREPNRVDILNDLKGLSFKEAYRKKKTVKIERATLNIVSLDHLIQLKKAANRPQDRLDIQRLKQIKKRMTNE